MPTTEQSTEAQKDKDKKASQTRGLIPFKPGQSGNPAGRPRKLISTMTGIGYKQSEVTDTLLNILALTMDELKLVYENPSSTVLEKAVANAVRTGIAKGSLYNIETILSRAIGKPRETIEQKTEVNIKSFKVRTVQVGVPFAGREADVDCAVPQAEPVVTEDIEHEEEDY